MKKKNTKMILFVMLILSIVIFLSILFFKFYDPKENKNNDTPVMEYEKINNKIPSVNYEEEINKLKTEYNNEDIVGILTIENSDFSEIIVQTTDNDYYLKHSISRQPDWKGQGFLDYRLDINNSKKILIYGHNAPKQYIPFKFFENYYDSSYLNEHKYMYLQTSKEIKKFEIFSVYVEVSDWSYFSKINFTTEESYYKHILELKNKSLYDTGVNITKEDEILIIQTCSYHEKYKAYENKFLLIIGKKIDNIDN